MNYQLYFVTAYSSRSNAFARFLITADSALHAGDMVRESLGGDYKVSGCQYVTPCEREVWMEV